MAKTGCPGLVRYFGRELKRWLYSEAGGWPFIPGHYASWVSGGCWVLARALHEWIGLRSELQVIYSFTDSEYFADKMPQHVVVKIGNCYLDGDGASTEHALLSRWINKEGLAEPELRPMDVEKLETAGIECPIGPVRDVVRELNRRFGPGSALLDA